MVPFYFVGKDQCVQTVSSMVENGSISGNTSRATLDEMGPEEVEQTVATPMFIVHRRNSQSSLVPFPENIAMESSDDASRRSSIRGTAFQTENGPRPAAEESSGRDGRSVTLTTFAPIARSHSDCLGRSKSDITDDVNVKRALSSASNHKHEKWRERRLENEISSQEADMIRAKSRAMVASLKREDNISDSHTLTKLCQPIQMETSYVSSDYHHDNLTDVLDNSVSNDSNSETWSNLYDETDGAESERDGDSKVAETKQPQEFEKNTPAKPKRKGHKKEKKTKELATPKRKVNNKQKKVAEEKGLMASANFLASMTLSLTNKDSSSTLLADTKDTKGGKEAQPSELETSAEDSERDRPTDLALVLEPTIQSNEEKQSTKIEGTASESAIEPASLETGRTVLSSGNPFLSDFGATVDIDTLRSRSLTNPFLAPDLQDPQSVESVNVNPFFAAFSEAGEKQELDEASGDLNTNPDQTTSDAHLVATPGEQTTQTPPRPPISIPRRHAYVNAHQDPKYVRGVWRTAALAIRTCHGYKLNGTGLQQSVDVAEML